MKDITDTVNDVCTDYCYVMGYSYVCAVGYCLYGTLLLHPRWTACPVRIRAHHYICVYSDINNCISTPKIFIIDYVPSTNVSFFN